MSVSLPRIIILRRCVGRPRRSAVRVRNQDGNDHQWWLRCHHVLQYLFLVVQSSKSLHLFSFLFKWKPYLSCSAILWFEPGKIFSGFIIFHFIFSIFLHIFSLILMYLCIRWKHFNASDCHWVLQAFVETFFNLICNAAVSFCCLSLCFCSSRALPLLLSSCVCSLFSFIGSMFWSHWQNSKCSSRKIGCGSSVSQKCSL